MIIRTSKQMFKLVPEGQQDLLVTKVELLPSGKPQTVKFTYTHEDGGTLLENLNLTHPVANNILSQRCDMALGGVPEGTPVELSTVPDLFLGKIVTAMIVHNHGKGENADKVYANIKYVMDIREGEGDGVDDL